MLATGRRCATIRFPWRNLPLRHISVGCVIILVSNALGQSPPTSELGDMRVRLLAPLTTKLNRKGDIVSASVLEPSRYEGAILEGDVLEVRPGTSPSNNRSSIQFQFHTLHAPGGSLPVAVDLVSVVNSKKQPDSDENGTELELAGGTTLGGLRSAIAGRLHRDASDSAPVSGVASRLSVKAASLSFAPGSELTLRYKLKSR
jgi:hypothetical protein